MKDIKVYKVGGSVLAEPDDFLKVVRQILKFKHPYNCLVTSALKGQTDELIARYTKAIPEPDFYNFERFVGMGEIQSAIIFESAFKCLGVEARAILPGMKEWPIHIKLKSKAQLSPTKSNEKREFTLLPKSKTITKKYLLPLLQKKVVLILPGFVAEDENNNMITLGRGGSDISALLIAELLGAAELILIKDVGGILSVEPKLVSDATMIKKLSWAELGALAASGAQVLNPISLKHRDKLPKLRVIGNNADDTNVGTVVHFYKNVSIALGDRTFGVITFIGEKIPQTPGILNRVASVLNKAKISIHSITISDNIIAIYVEEEEAEIAYRLLSKLLSEVKHLKALNLKKGIAKIVIRSLKFINEPGAIKRIITPIAREKINIWEVLTVHTDIMVFVESQHKIKVYNIIKNLFRKE